MNWIKENRKRLGKSQEEMAEELGFSRTLITKWETGRANVTYANTEILCEYFEIDIDQAINSKTIWNIIELERKRLLRNILISTFWFIWNVGIIAWGCIELSNNSNPILWEILIPLLVLALGYASFVRGRNLERSKDKKYVYMSYLKRHLSRDKFKTLNKTTKNMENKIHELLEDKEK